MTVVRSNTMELRRAADAILRTQSTTSSLSAHILSARTTCCALGSRRYISNTPPQNAVRPRATTSAAPPSPPASNPTEQSTASPDDLASMLNWKNGPRRQSRYGMAYTGKSREQALNGGNSAMDLLSTLNSTSRASRQSSRIMETERMLDPKGSDTLKLLDKFSPTSLVPERKRTPLRMNPRLGRTVTLGGNIDLGRGLKLLEQSCARNAVRKDSTKQRFHERPGLKRKRMKRAGWRKRFAQGFSAIVKRVKQLKNQGW
ncbi:hypothetical protein BP5796_02163 [Coleophoma crateriformis]|uniref:Ribosomal protein S21 n=1 Tax=Coleophoma crateriformis TaxID=565419 RepID=A0A3D8SZ02_9HELO|nr:hypothetical protein BP5796_02163 [Coleophoma crateriformis]